MLNKRKQTNKQTGVKIRNFWGGENATGKSRGQRGQTCLLRMLDCRKL